MRPVDTPSLAATSAMRVAPKPRSITTWQVTSRISLRRSSTVGLRTSAHVSARTPVLLGSCRRPCRPKGLLAPQFGVVPDALGIVRCHRLLGAFVHQKRDATRREDETRREPATERD